MRKFKLIKEYPGSSSLGTIFHIGGFAGDVSKYPEFFEEVVEKDYEVLIAKVVPYTILSVKRLSDEEIFTVGDLINLQPILTGELKQDRILAIKIIDNKIRFKMNFQINHSWGSSYTLSFIKKVVEKDYQILDTIIKNNLKQEISSIKRLSDGEVFTIGDKVKVCKHGSIKMIDSIILNANSYVKEGIWFRYDSGSSHLTHAIKQKSPIFLTHDGKDIFEEDTVWYVNKENLDLDHFRTHANVTFRSDINSYFLTREEAEDYIKRNKVLFITEDGVGIKKGDMIHGVYRISHTISNTVVGFNNGVCDPFEAVFSTRAAAENYLVQKSHSLSIEDFWEFVCWGGSNIAKSKRLKRLVKERLNLK